ncbi:hypothetical protein HK098_005231 [Nowakowskiella sp. JEL0407]|nr:hypothetical protein HK098_005231 [Nowakowskiella sp. JEL0407]
MELLQSMPKFKDLPPKSASLLASVMEEYNITKGTKIVKEGDPSQYAYFIASGEAEAFKNYGKSEETKLKIMRKGDIFGLSSMLDHSSHSSTVVALSNPSTKTYRISIELFNKVINEDPGISVTICKHLSHEYKDFMKKTSHDTAHSVKAAPIVPIVAITEVQTLKRDNNNVVTMAVFDHKPYERAYFDREIKKFNEINAIKLECKFHEYKLNKDSANLAKGAKIVCMFVNDDGGTEVLKQLHEYGVKMIAMRCAGFNNCDLKTCQDLGISVARVPAYSPYAVAEHCVALLLALNRKIHLAYNRVKTGNFSLNNLVGFDIHGKTVGVIGTGKIGYCFIQIMLGFGCNVIGYDMYKNKELESTENFKYVEDLNELLTESHIISIHCPLMADNKYMINSETLKKVPKGAILINTSRGALIKTSDLIESLKEGHLGGAGLDVYEDETSYFFEDKSAEVIGDDVLARLLSFQNVVITSHQAFLTEEALTAISKVTVSNVQEFIVQNKSMKELNNSVNL